MELHLATEVWDSLSELNGRYWNKFEAKYTKQSEDGSDYAGLALFCNKMWFLSMRRFERSKARASGLQGCV